jgi:hypothetical protein
MVSHCANPICHRPFHSLKQGCLVVLPPLRKSPASETAQLDIAWLCEDCARSLNVYRGADGRVQVARNRAAAA